jgi:rhodanese-related sulfurtransferase
MFVKKTVTAFFVILYSLSVFAGSTPKISQSELITLLAQQNNSAYIVLDVRTPKEFNDGHIEGAINVSHSTITNNLALLNKHKDKTVVVHCRSGRRAVSAEKALQANGFSDVRHLEGDMNAWLDANLPVVQQ